MSTTRDGDGGGRPRHTVSERRDATAPRMRYEALVDVGSRSVGGFEAESLDVSLDGIRLRTAYLPATGEKLVCRFDGFGGEIVAEGQVAWCHDEGRGGEFGVRFTRLDARAMELLSGMCTAEEAPGEAPAQVDPGAAQPGARVRLHIQGLGSPMRARVRDVARGEVLIGSNLEFLRVGRDVELEDVEQKRSRIAHIEHVSVEIDPETRIPQLVVALLYDGAAAEVDEHDLTTAPRRVVHVREEPPAETTPEPTVIDRDESPSVAPVTVRATPQPAPAERPRERAPLRDRPQPRRERAEQPAAPAPEDVGDDHLEEIDDDAEPVAPAMAAAAAARVGALAKRVGPALASAGAGASAAMGRMLASVKRRRAERRDEKVRARAPKRTTAPPPSGALRSKGKRLFREAQRDSEPPPEPSEAPAPRRDRRRTVFGVVLGVMAVVAIYFASSHLSQAQDGSDSASVSADADAQAAAPTMLPGETPPPAAAGEGAVPTTNVPLYGATPLSTTEPVPVPPNLDGKEEAGDQPGGGDDKPKEADLQSEWGFGDVVNPTVLRLKMDGKLEGLRGTESPTGFTITIPGRKSNQSAAGLARKDKRIESVNVVNYPDRAEVTVRFKKEVPPFLAKAKGKRLIIEISSAKKKGDKSENDDEDDDEDEPSKRSAKKKRR